MGSRAKMGALAAATTALALSGCNVAIVAGIVVFATSGKSSTPSGIPTPSIASVVPSSGPVAGGTSITIAGANFPTDAAVLVGGVTASHVVVLDPGTITALVPHGRASGPADVTVTDPHGGSGTSPSAFTFTDSPQTVTVSNLTSPQRGNIVVGFTIADPDSDASSVRIEIDSGTGFQPIPSQQILAGDLTDLLTSPEGTFHSIAYDSASAFPGAVIANARVRVTPIDAEGRVGTPAVSNAFRISNHVPVGIALTQPGNGAFHVAIPYQVIIRDAHAQGTLQVTALTWTDEGTGGSGTTTVASGQRLGTIPNPTNATLLPVVTVWDALADLGFGNNHLVTVTVTVSDGPTSKSATSAPFFVSNGPLSQPVLVPTQEICNGFTVGDVTGDGRPDIVVGSAEHGIQVAPNRGRSFAPAVLVPAPPLPQPSSPFPGPGGLLSATASLAGGAALDVNGDGAVDAMCADSAYGPASTQPLVSSLHAALDDANSDRPYGYVHAIAHQATLRLVQRNGALDVANAVWESAAASIANRAPHVFASGGTIFPAVATGDPTLDSIGWFDQAILAADLDGPGSPGFGSTDLVLLHGISQLGRANAGDTRGCVVIRQIDPSTRALGPCFYLDPTDMGSLPCSCAVADLLSASRTAALFASAPFNATARPGSPDIVVANTGDSSLTFYLQLAPASWAGGVYTPPKFTSLRLPMSAIDPSTPPGDTAGVAVGDLDGDGSNDFVVVGLFTKKLTVFLYCTDPAAPGSLLPLTGGLLPFRKASTVAFELSGAGVPVIADVTGDGKPDVIVPFLLSPEFEVFVSSGSASGAPRFVAVEYQVPFGVSGLAALDFDGDGRTDVAVFMRESTMICYQTAAGTLDPNFIPIVAGDSPGNLTVGDALGTGTPQILCPNRGDGTVTVYARDAAHTLAVAAVYDTALNGAVQPFLPSDVIVADATGDGMRDLVVLCASVLQGAQARGGFEVFPGPLAAGSTVAAVRTAAFPGSSVGFDVGDLNGDGIPDVVLTSVAAQGGITIFTGTGGGAFTTTTVPSVLPQAVKLVDLDGDGHVDLVVAANGQILVYWNGGALPGQPGFVGYGNLAGTPSVVSSVDDARSMAVADLNGDGLLDLVATHSVDGLGWIVLQMQPRSFVDAPLIVGGQPNQVAIGDLDSDGLPDIAITWGADALVAVYRQNPKKTGPSDMFLSPVTYTTLASPSGCVIVDVDGDGRNDLVVSSRTTNTLNVFLQR